MCNDAREQGDLLKRIIVLERSLITIRELLQLNVLALFFLYLYDLWDFLLPIIS